MLKVFETLSVGIPTDLTEAAARQIIHAGGLAPGMNPATRAAVKLGLDSGFEIWWASKVASRIDGRKSSAAEMD